jgi:quinol monooxygenase YgiN
MFVTLVFHHPRPEHLEDFAAFMKRIEAGMQGTDGLLSIESYKDPGSGDLVAIGRWESPEHAQAGVPKLVAIGGRDPEWTDRPDDLHRLVSI